jgi:hypothetical protein
MPLKPPGAEPQPPHPCPGGKTADATLQASRCDSSTFNHNERTVMATHPKAKQQPPLQPKEKRAKVALFPSLNAAAVLCDYIKPLGEHDLISLNSQVRASIEEVQAGDLSEAEGMLMGQAQALQAMFMNFAKRASYQKQVSNIESLVRMALKAQNQCRMTLETLANVKNPPVVIARQANIAHGPQQVNNDAARNTPAPRTGSRATKPDRANELLEAKNGERLDTRATGTAGSAHPSMATVGKGHRSAHE